MNYKNYTLLILYFSLHLSIYGTQQEERYTIIQLLLNRYQRAFTMLDINADQGYYSFRTAHDHDSVCVMMEANSHLLDLCKKRPELSNIVLLNTSPTPNTLKHLGECEHFDVILALNGLSTLNDQRYETIDTILNLGDHIILDVASDDIHLKKFISTKGGQILGEVTTENDVQSTIYVIESSNIYLQRKTWLREIMHQKIYRIESSFNHKELTKPASWPNGALKTTPWIPGINLCTFKMCHGTYPTSEQLKNSLLNIKDAKHTDWLINNMVVQGSSLALIDCDDALCKRYYSETLLYAHQEMLDLNDPKQIEHYFWHTLIKVPVSINRTVKFFGQLFPPFSLIFDVGTSDEVLIDRYLGYGAKVVSCNPNIHITNPLHSISMLENLSVTTDVFLKEKTGSDATIDNMIAYFGMPRFCISHVPAESAYESLKTLSQSIECIAFKFDVRHKADLILCLSYLTSLGYKKFNFSTRDLPGFILESNRYLNTHKEWAISVDELLHEIDAFSLLDHDGSRLWGYVYAR